MAMYDREGIAGGKEEYCRWWNPLLFYLHIMRDESLTVRPGLRGMPAMMEHQEINREAALLFITCEGCGAEMRLELERVKNVIRSAWTI
jgi:hypothetical protein